MQSQMLQSQIRENKHMKQQSLHMKLWLQFDNYNMWIGYSVQNAVLMFIVQFNVHS